MIKNKVVFITGGAGFIATAVIRRLISSNRVIVWDNFARNSLKYFGLEGHPNLTVFKGDILDLDGLQKAIAPDTDIVIHTAAIAGIKTVTQDPVMTWEVNVLGTVNILKALHNLGLVERLERFVAFSTSEVFGQAALRVQESMPLVLPPIGELRWIYAASKLASEYLVYCYYKKFGLKACIVRPFNIFGEGQVGEGAIQRFIKQAIVNNPITIYGDGSQVRSWCHVDDMVQGLLLCLEKPEAVGEVFNIGNPANTITTLSLAEKVVQITGSRSSISFLAREGTADVELRIPNISKAQELLGYKPVIGLDEGIRRTAEWYKSHLQEGA